MHYTYVTDTKLAVSLMWLFLCQGTLLAEYTWIYPLPQRCIRQIKSGPKSIILSTGTVTVSQGSRNKVIFSVGRTDLCSEWNSTIFPMKRKSSDKAKVSRRLLKLKKTTGICNYIQALHNVPLKWTVMCICLIMKSGTLITAVLCFHSHSPLRCVCIHCSISQYGGISHVHPAQETHLLVMYN